MYYSRTHEDGKIDKRYTVDLEWMGEVRQYFVLRFCGDYIGKFIDLPSATLRAIGHYNTLIGGKVFVNQLTVEP